MKLSILSRLTIWYLLVLLVTTFSSAIILESALRYELNSRVDGDLEQISGQVQQANHTTLVSVVTPPQPGGQTPKVSLHWPYLGLYFTIYDENGVAVAHSETLGSDRLPVTSAQFRAAQSGTALLISSQTQALGPLRMYSSPILVGGEYAGMLVIADPLGPVNTSLSRSRGVLAAGVLGTILLCSFAGWLIVRSVLRTIDEITLAANRISSTGDLGQRIVVGNSNDEVSRLARVFNTMLDRTQEAFASQQRFLADSSHELRTPLTIIRGNIDLLKRPLSEADRQEALRAVDQESSRMSRLVTDLLLLSQLDAHQVMAFGPVDLLEIVQDVCRAGRMLAPQRAIRLAHAEPVVIEGDGDRLKQVFINLLENAIKYSPEGDSITVSMRLEDGHVAVSVRDDGPGIAPEHIPHLFDRFYRAEEGRKHARGGAGLGLSIVQYIAQAHGGRVEVESAPGQGATFTVWLPATVPTGAAETFAEDDELSAEPLAGLALSGE